ncbi:MAG: hypothetical protein EOQ29_10430 [Mesorhizobium sp.]|nr:MAG: hypothetical protein EOQ29_10430 [Mesorhizobium sp.]TIS49525.1 MAG: hypothetical protein E5W96_13330 [Mesorhizobium sp.]
MSAFMFSRRRCPSSACPSSAAAALQLRRVDRHLLPVKDGEKGRAPALVTPSPRSSRGEGKGEGQRLRSRMGS